jgi:hypothetical protein
LDIFQITSKNNIKSTYKRKLLSVSSMLSPEGISSISMLEVQQIGSDDMPEQPRERYFRDIARFYDPFSELPDADMYLTLAESYGSPILELASGTGRISFILAEAGYEVTGVEAAPEMLEIAKEKLSHLSKDIQDRVILH